MELQGRKIAILVSPRGTEEPEFTKPRQVIEDAGGVVTVVSFESGMARAANNDLDEGGCYPIDQILEDVTADDFDALVVPGGSVGADRLRGNDQAVSLARAFFAQEKLAALICHAPWLLVEADVLDGRTLTSYATLKSDIENAGGRWVGEEIVVDGLITNLDPKNLPAFCA
ncbi:MAG: DJ-1/PfpI family protein [Rhodanobacter sp.]